MNPPEPSIPAGEEPLAVFTHLARAGLLLEAMQKESLGTFDLSFVEYSVLRLLARAGAAHQLSPSRLAEQVVRTTGAMTKILDRLERRGLLERVPDPTDRRALLVGLTDEGLEQSDKASAAYIVVRSRVLEGLAAEEIATIITGVGRLAELLDQHQTRPGGRLP